MGASDGDKEIIVASDPGEEERQVPGHTGQQ